MHSDISWRRLCSCDVSDPKERVIDYFGGLKIGEPKTADYRDAHNRSMGSSWHTSPPQLGFQICLWSASSIEAM